MTEHRTPEVTRVFIHLNTPLSAGEFAMPVIPWFADGGTPKAMSDAVDSIFEVLQGGQGVLTIPVGPEKSVLIPLQSIDHVEICYTALEVDDEA